MKKKTLLTICSLILVSVVSVMGTLAYLTDRSSVTNTFTVGNVKINLDEAEVTPDGVPVTPANRVAGNEYHLIPGQTYTKDPTLTVLKGSEECYVRMIVTFNCKSVLDEIFPNANLTEIFAGYDTDKWDDYSVVREGDTIVYEFRYAEGNGKVNAKESNVKLDALFDSFTLPGAITGEQLEKLQDFKITVEGHAIQAATFESDDAAWAAFDAQIAAEPTTETTAP